MKDNELLFDRKSHVLYSKPCRKEIRAKIASTIQKPNKRLFENRYSGSTRSFSPTGAPTWAANGASTTAWAAPTTVSPS